MSLKAWQRRFLVGVVGTLALSVVVGNLIASSHWVNHPFPGFFVYGNLTVSPDFLPGWTGREEGLRFLDRVVALDGAPVHNPGTIYEKVRSMAPETDFHYTVERGGRLMSLTVPSLRFTFQDWLLTYGIYLLTGLCFLGIGFTPFYVRSTSPPAIALFIMVGAVFVWFGTTFDAMTTQVLPKEVRALAFALTPSAGIHLGLTFSGIFRQARVSRWLLATVYGISALIGTAYSLSFYNEPGVWQAVLKASYGYCLLGALVFLLLLSPRLYRSESDLERSRLRVIAVGSILGFFIPTLGTVLDSLFDWGIPHNALLLGAVFFPLSVTYALLQYNLFDIDAILKVGLTRGGLTALLLLIYVAVVFLLGVPFGIYHNDPAVPLLFSLLVALLFNPLLRWIEGVVGRYVYGREYDSVQLQREISLLLRSLSKPQTVTAEFLEAISRSIGIENACIFFRRQEHEDSYGVARSGMEVQEGAESLLAAWVDILEARQQGISKDQAEMDPIYEENRARLLNIFRELKLELLIPMIFERKPLGFVCLGKKRSGRAYSADDFRLFSSLADQLALALKNGALFEESEKDKEKYEFLYDRSQQMNERLVQMDRKQKHFVANISHELRTPLSTILGYTEVLLNPGFGGDKRMILERIVTNGRDLSQLMDGLLEFSRIESGSASAKVQEVNVRELFQSLELMTRRLLKDRSIAFRTRVEALLTTVRTDGKTVQQILIHLLTNALKFTHRGEIRLESRPIGGGEIRAVEFMVSDTGIGISEKDQEAIFEEFRQLDGSSTRRYGGTGLGLSLCKKLAQTLGGRIGVESEIGRGSVFKLLIPVGLPPALQGRQLGETPGRESAHFSS